MKLNILKHIANTKTVSKFEKWALKTTPDKNNPAKKISNYEKMQKVYPIAFMTFAAVVQSVFICKEKEMPKERRIPLALNNLINAVMSITGGILISKPTNKYLDKILERANVLYEHNPNKANLINGIKTAIPFIIPALLFRYVGAVLATPLADKANNFLVKKGLVDYSKEDNRSDKKVDYKV